MKRLSRWELYRAEADSWHSGVWEEGTERTAAERQTTLPFQTASSHWVLETALSSTVTYEPTLPTGKHSKHWTTGTAWAPNKSWVWKVPPCRVRDSRCLEVLGAEAGIVYKCGSHEYFNIPAAVVTVSVFTCVLSFLFIACASPQMVYCKTQQKTNMIWSWLCTFAVLLMQLCS